MKPGKIGIAVIYLLALIVAVLVVWGTVMMLRPQMDERLYAQYRDLPQAKFLPPNTQHTLLAEACTRYNQKQYSFALPLFQKDTTAVFSLERQYFTGLCLLELNKMKEAQDVFRSLSDHKNWRLEGGYYLALAYLRDHQRAQCRELLRSDFRQSPRFERIKKLYGKL